MGRNALEIEKISAILGGRRKKKKEKKRRKKKKKKKKGAGVVYEKHFMNLYK